MSRLIFTYIISIFVGTICLSLQADAQDGMQKEIVASYELAKRSAPREKVYVNFDRNTYLTPDTIWFKGYIVNNNGPTYTPISGVLHVELINFKGTVVESVALPTILGLAWGSFVLNPRKHLPGKYTLRAYTQWMRNFDDVAFFKAQLNIIAADKTPKPQPATGNVNESVLTVPMGAQKQDIDVQFLPEGGKWIVGHRQKMAFKAMASDGRGVKISGSVLNGKGDKIMSFVSNDKGMGSFWLLPLAGEKYTAEITSLKGGTSSALPLAQLSGHALSVDPNYSADSVEIVLSSISAEDELLLVGQSRGSLSFIAPLRATNRKRMLRVGKDIFPGGVSQILVMDASGRVLNQRNFFLQTDDLTIGVTTAKESYGLHDSIPITMKVTDLAGQPVSGSFSVTVTG